MRIDWITVVAQIVNFLILVYLLKRFLYQPVIRAMERREQRIADQVKEAAEREERADARARDYQEKLRDLEHEQSRLMDRAREEAEEARKILLQEAREEVARIRQGWQRQTQQEKEEFLKALRRQAGDAVLGIARKVLADLSGAELEARMVEQFVQRLKELDRASRRAFEESDEPVRIATSFELGAPARSHLSRIVHEHLVPDADVEYGENPALVCGIELTAGGRRLTWSLADYLEELSEGVGKAFDRVRADGAASESEESHASGSSG